MPRAEEFRFAIFGRIVYTDHFIKELHRLGFPKPLVIVSPDEEYVRDRRLLSQFGLFGDLEACAAEGLAKLYKMANVNTENALSLLKEYKCNIGFSINCRNIIKKPIIDFFKGNIFNIHDSYLPNERGGALNTWRILNGINIVGNTIHYLEEGIDTGPIVLRRKADMKKANPLPVDYLLGEKENCEYLLSRFLDMLLENENINAISQENDKSYYYPRLFTEINGAINWDWEVYSVERFIRAFSTPYPSAFTYYGDKRINILDSFVDTTVSQEFHPFCNGKIVTVLDNKNVRVIAGGRALILTEIAVDGVTMSPGEYLSVKYSLRSDINDLTRARCHVPTTIEMGKAEMKERS